MECEFCRDDFKNEFLSRVKFDDGEIYLICNSCEERAKYLKDHDKANGEGKYA